jgi:1-pyrroline-5-carboxylate dehydrogenase
MSNAFFNVPVAKNEPVKSYAPDSAERVSLLAKYNEMYHQQPIDVPMYIGAEEVRTSTKKTITSPHDHQKVLGYFNVGDAKHVEKAIQAALEAKKLLIY